MPGEVLIVERWTGEGGSEQVIAVCGDDEQARTAMLARWASDPDARLRVRAWTVDGGQHAQLHVWDGERGDFTHPTFGWQTRQTTPPEVAAAGDLIIQARRLLARANALCDTSKGAFQVVLVRPDTGPPPGTDWPCEAYGSDPAMVAVGARCFFADPHQRVCADQAECGHKMAAERQRLFDRIGELAGQGDQAAVYLAGQFDGPEQLLGGGAEDSSRPVLTISWMDSTAVCLNLICACGYNGHFDGEGSSTAKCPNCGQHYDLDGRIALTPVDPLPDGHAVIRDWFNDDDDESPEREPSPSKLAILLGRYLWDVKHERITLRLEET